MPDNKIVGNFLFKMHLFMMGRKRGGGREREREYTHMCRCLHASVARGCMSVCLSHSLHLPLSQGFSLNLGLILSHLYNQSLYYNNTHLCLFLRARDAA